MTRSRRGPRSLFLFLVLGLVIPATAPLLAKEKPWYALGYRAESAGLYKTEVLIDFSYARVGKVNLLADIYRPYNLVGLAPAVVVVHGGGWRHFNRKVVEGFCHLLASQGFAAVAVDYRLSKVAAWPACLYDVKAAVRWVRANAKRFNIDPTRIGILGDSAGGHLAALVGTTGAENILDGAEGAAGVSSAVQAVVAYYGVYDLTAMPRLARERGWIPQLFKAPPSARPQLYREASPIRYASAGDPPFLLVHGMEDRIVPVDQSMLMQKALETAGVPVSLVTVQNADHMLVKRKGNPIPALATVDAMVFGFLKEHLAASTP